MAVKKWSKTQRAKFLATIKARKKGGKRKPYRKPRIVNAVQSGNRELLIRIELV